MPEKNLLIRADASMEIGVGHVMRCIALAQSWQATGGAVFFAIAAGHLELNERLKSEKFKIVSIKAQPGTPDDLTQTLKCRETIDADWLVLDGFHFCQEYRTALRNRTRFFLLLDDHGDRPPYDCDIVLNVNPQASPDMYTVSDRPRVLAGPKYALLRKEFLESTQKKSNIPAIARTLLITFGGADPHNVTLKVLDAVHSLALPLDVTVVVGPNNRHRESLQAAIGKLRCPAKLLLNPDNMPHLISQADLAITAGGGTCYELAFLGTPMFLVTMAENHERTVDGYAKASAAFAAGWFDSLDVRSLARALSRVICDSKFRENLQENARRLVDGQGAHRVVQEMSQISWPYQRQHA